MQTGSFKGNLPPESAPVHSTASGKGGKEGTKFTHHTKSYLEYANMFIQWQLTPWGCTSSQHSKWVKEVRKEQIFTNHTKSYLEHANMFIQRHLTPWGCISSEHSKWVKEAKEGMNFHPTQISHSSHKIVCTHVHSEATYNLREHQFTAQQVGKGGKRSEFSLNK